MAWLYRRLFLGQRGLQPDVIFFIKVSIRIIWSMVLLLALKPVQEEVVGFKEPH